MPSTVSPVGSGKSTGVFALSLAGLGKSPELFASSLAGSCMAPSSAMDVTEKPWKETDSPHSNGVEAAHGPSPSLPTPS